MEPPPLKRVRLCGPSEPRQPVCWTDMQTAGNGTVVENGNGVSPLANGCGDKVEKEMKTHRKRGQPLSETDSDIIRLIGQHLREMGLQ